jgi:hypothetical protein
MAVQQAARPSAAHDLKTLVLSRHPAILIETAEPARGARTRVGCVRRAAGAFRLPLSVSRREDIDALRQRAAGRFVPVR